MKTILGISAFYHDSAATILIDGKIVAAAQEERFTRKKHDSSYPFNAIEFVLDFVKIKLSDVDQIIFFEKPFLKFVVIGVSTKPGFTVRTETPDLYKR